MAERDILPDNSMKARTREQGERSVPERKHGQMVAKRLDGPVKETTGQKFKKLFFSDDVDNVGEYLVKDLMIPYAKDIFMNFMSAVLWGNRADYSSHRGSIIGSSGRTNYNSISSAGRVRNRSDGRVRERETNRNEFNLDNLRFRSRAEADEVLRQMEEYIDEFGQVTVGYLYEILGESASQWTVETYGWTDLSGARITRVQNGYLLTLPRPARFER